MVKLNIGRFFHRRFCSYRPYIYHFIHRAPLSQQYGSEQAAKRSERDFSLSLRCFGVLRYLIIKKGTMKNIVPPAYVSAPEGYCLFSRKRTSMFHVVQSTMPLSERPQQLWNLITASTVASPNSPLTLTLGILSYHSAAFLSIACMI